MKKNPFYEKPSMQVLELKQQQQLLAGSSGNVTTLNSMGNPEDL